MPYTAMHPPTNTFSNSVPILKSCDSCLHLQATKSDMCTSVQIKSLQYPE